MANGRNVPVVAKVSVDKKRRLEEERTALGLSMSEHLANIIDLYFALTAVGLIGAQAGIKS
jgi:hypothetical protein